MYRDKEFPEPEGQEGRLYFMIRNSETFEEASLIPEDAPVEPPTGAAVLAVLEELGIVGMWADRTDIEDSGEFARNLREQSQERTSE